MRCSLAALPGVRDASSRVGTSPRSNAGESQRRGEADDSKAGERRGRKWAQRSPADRGAALDVLVDARLLHRRISGLERVQAGLLRALAARPEIGRLRALVARGCEIQHPLPAGVERVETDSAQDLLAAVAGPDRASRPEVFHTTWFADREAWDLLAVSAARSAVVTAHDTILASHPDYFASAEAHAWHLRFARELTARGDRVLVATASAARDATDCFGVAPDRIDVVPWGVDERWRTRLSETELRERLAHLDLHDDYFAMVGRSYVHKDPLTVFEALRRLGGAVRLVCVGERVVPLYGGVAIDRELRSRGLSERVRWLDGLDDVEVQAVLQGSRGLIFASRHEGFGLPLLEAMALGVPVVAARASSSPEVAADAALWFEPGDAEGLAAALGTLWAGGERVRTLVCRGLERAAAFTWERTAEAMVDVYRRARSLGYARPRDSGQALVEALAAYPFELFRSDEGWKERCLRLEAELRATILARDRVFERAHRRDTSGWRLLLHGVRRRRSSEQESGS